MLRLDCVFRQGAVVSAGIPVQRPGGCVLLVIEQAGKGLCWPYC